LTSIKTHKEGQAEEKAYQEKQRASENVAKDIAKK
jgi:hypothetical protein